MRRARPISAAKPGPTAAQRQRGEGGRGSQRRGLGSLDYVLVLGVIIPIVAIVMPLGRRILQLVYEMMFVFISWPFL